MTDVHDYGAAAIELEILRRLIEQYCPEIAFNGFSASGARNGEYSFRMPIDDGTGMQIVWVQAPVLPDGSPREVLGRWRFRKVGEPGWQHAHHVENVVDWLRSMLDTPAPFA